MHTKVCLNVRHRVVSPSPHRRKNCVSRNQAQTLSHERVTRQPPTLDCGSTTHEYLLRRVWGPQNSGDARLVRAFVKKLRRKLGDVATSPAYIVTEPRVGYRMPKAVSSEPATNV